MVEAGTATFQNDMVRLGLDAAGSSITTGLSMYQGHRRRDRQLLLRQRLHWRHGGYFGIEYVCLK